MLIINVTKDKLSFKQDINLNKGEYNVTQCNFIFSKEYDGLVKKAVFFVDDKKYVMNIVNDICDIPYEVLEHKGNIEIGVFAYAIDESENHILRYSPDPLPKTVIDGSYVTNYDNNKPIVPSEFEQYQQALNNGLNKVSEQLIVMKQISQNTQEKGDYAQTQGDYAKEQGDYAKEQGTYAKEQGNTAKEQSDCAQTQGTYAKEQGDYAKEQGTYAKEQGNTAKEQSDCAQTQGTYAKEQGDYAKEQGTYAKEQGDYAKDTADDTKDKADKGFFDGKSLEFIWEDTKLGVRQSGDTEYQFVNLQGIQGIKGDTGEPFGIKKTYSSVQLMNNDFDNMKCGDYVMIASNVDEEDNAKLYTKGESEWIFITDFSGAMGIQGPVGKTPKLSVGNVATVEPDEKATVTISGTDENPILNFSLPKGKTGETGAKGDTGETGATGNGIKDIVKKSTESLVDTYQINYTDGKNTTYEVKNGADGNVLQQEEIDKLNTEIDELVSVLPQKTAIGTNTLNYDKAKAFRLLKGEYNGNEEQLTTTGKNLLRCVKTKPETINGVTFTPIYNNGLLLYINVNGTSTANTNFYISTDSFANNETLQPGTYTLSDGVIGEDGTKYFTYVDVELSADYNLSTVAEKTVTISQETKLKSRIVVRSGVTLNNVKFYPLLEKSSSATPYEPHTGNQPSPNPNYPQKIEVLKGGNLFKVKTDTINEITLTYNKAKSCYILNGTASAFTIFRSTIDEINEDHILSYKTNISASGLFVCTRDKNAMLVDQLQCINTSDNVISRKTGIVSVEINITSGTNLNNVELYPTLVLGTQKKTYLPYGHIGIKRTGKNKFHVKDRTVTKNGVTATVKDNVIIVNGTNTNTIAYGLIAWDKSNEFDLEFDTEYTISYKGDMPSGCYFVINGTLKGTAREDSIAIISETNKKQTFRILTTKFDKVSQYFVGILGTTTTINGEFTIQIEKGSSATEYEPYQEQIVPLDLKGNEVLSGDKIHVDLKGNAKLIKNWGKVVLNGSENISIVMPDFATENSSIFDLHRFIVDEKLSNITSIPNIKCSHLLADTGYNIRQNEINAISIWDQKTIGILFRIVGLKTIEEVKEWLRNNNMTIYYPFEEPQIIDLGQIEPIKTFSGVNNVEILATLESTAMQETYVNDLQEEISSQSDRILALETAIKNMQTSPESLEEGEISSNDLSVE